VKIKRIARSRPLTKQTALQTLISKGSLLEHAQKIQDIAFSTPQRNRLTGSVGHNRTVEYIIEQLSSSEVLKQFYQITVQPWQSLSSKQAKGSLVVNSASLVSLQPARFSNRGEFKAPLVLISQSGCITVCIITLASLNNLLNLSRITMAQRPRVLLLLSIAEDVNFCKSQLQLLELVWLRS
jgi:hypothetical protein